MRFQAKPLNIHTPGLRSSRPRLRRVVDLSTGPRRVRRSTLGFIDPVTAVTLVQQAVDFLNPLEWFGKGRREADAIGPTQDKVNQTIAAIASSVGIGDWTQARLWAIPPGTTWGTLQQAAQGLQDLRAAYLRFLRDQNVFPDGRAPAQSANAVMPQLDGTGNYGLHATGGMPLPPPINPGFSWIAGPVPAGGLLGVVGRAMANAPRGGATAPLEVPNIFETTTPEGRTPSGSSMTAISLAPSGTAPVYGTQAPIPLPGEGAAAGVPIQQAGILSGDWLPLLAGLAVLGLLFGTRPKG